MKGLDQLLKMFDTFVNMFDKWYDDGYIWYFGIGVIILFCWIMIKG